MMYFKTPAEFKLYAESRSWTVSGDFVLFGDVKADADQVPAHAVIDMVLGYATELEMIV